MTSVARGGIEAIDDVTEPVGMIAFAPLDRVRGKMFSARARLGLGEPIVGSVVPERELAE